MRSTPLLIEAKPSEDYTVHVSFEDGLTADVDLSYLLDYGGVFKPFRDLDYFRQLRADAKAGTIVWPNAADIAPETLYAHAQRRVAATASGECNTEEAHWRRWVQIRRSSMNTAKARAMRPTDTVQARE